MDKTDLRNKRRQDKCHKKVPPPKPPKQTGASKGTKPTVPEAQHTAPLIVCDQRYGKRQIQQNWTEDRDLPSEGSESEDEQLNAADFEKLLALPSSTSGHFLLSSEKHWLAPETGLLGEDRKTCYSEYFRIDTKLLNASLGCIPFHQRLGYDESLFSASELISMRQKAEIQLGAYSKLCQEQTAQSKMDPVKRPKPVPCLVGKYALPENTAVPVESIERPGIEIIKKSTVAPVIHTPVETIMSALKIEVPVNVQQAPPSSSSSKPLSVPPATMKETKEDIQQWLDDILDI